MEAAKNLITYPKPYFEFRMSDILGQNFAPQDPAKYIENSISEEGYKISNVPLGKPVFVSEVLRAQKHGIPTVSSESMKSLMANMGKSGERTLEVDAMYKKSHHSYGVSERINREYGPGFKENALFGISTEHDRFGKRIKEALIVEEKEITSEKVRNFKERTSAKIGTVHDPIKDSLMLPEGKTFGLIELPDNYDAKYLVHRRANEVFRESKAFIRGILGRVRNRLNKMNWNKFDGLHNNCHFFDGNDNNALPPDAFLMILQRTGFPIEDSLGKYYN